MMPLPSGLSAVVGDDEPLARFLTQGNLFNTRGARPAAFMPNPKDHEKSVFRHGGNPREELWALGVEAGLPSIQAAAIVAARTVREVGLVVEAIEPPPRHAALRGWPVNQGDRDLQKAACKEIAALLAQRSRVIQFEARRG